MVTVMILLTVCLTVGRFVSSSFLKKIVSLGLVFLSGTLVAPICLLDPKRQWFTTTRLIRCVEN